VATANADVTHGRGGGWAAWPGGGRTAGSFARPPPCGLGRWRYLPRVHTTLPRGSAETILATRTFEQWIDGIFDHRVTEPAWFWDPRADTCVEEDDDTNVEYLARLFAGSEHLLRRFDNAQAGQGLNMIANNSCSDHAYSIVAGHAAWPARQRAIRSIFDMYAKFFASRCAEGLGHLSEADNPLNTICYMWWDVFPARGAPKDEAGEYIGVMERCLSLTHQACLEGALHGLGHWHHLSPERVESIVDQFLQKRNDLRPELVPYARRARNGGVL
jgi:hypothetical protein